ncbi:calcium and integrin-binding protein 1-like [Achroia grisella]|uniref:calcium and integrin-binding protein 1-like n=1 Tax=Achroia grisella TaxID=688607 RepID=UPI0027D2435E|nr:calcium and integrin-binding protein 1-like [Achroia grisella]
MGSNSSHPELTEERLEEYSVLTYLSKEEILYLMNKFQSIDANKVLENFDHRFGQEEIIGKFDILKNNPFRERIFHVFSSKKDGCFSFEDLLDLCSVMSLECPAKVKAVWAFQIFDIDNDKKISAGDIINIIDLLTSGCQNPDNFIDKQSKEEIAKIVMNEIKFNKCGNINLQEFEFVLSRLPEFKSTFYFRL